MGLIFARKIRTRTKFMILIISVKKRIIKIIIMVVVMAVHMKRIRKEMIKRTRK